MWIAGSNPASVLLFISLVEFFVIDFEKFKTLIVIILLIISSLLILQGVSNHLNLSYYKGFDHR